MTGYCDSCGMPPGECCGEGIGQALADVRTLDEWARAPRGMRAVLVAPWGDGRVSCELQQADIMPSQIHIATTPDAARHAAAEWVRGQVKL